MLEYVHDLPHFGSVEITDATGCSLSKKTSNLSASRAETGFRGDPARADKARFLDTTNDRKPALAGAACEIEPCPGM
jgi:hypothetical protein